METKHPIQPPVIDEHGTLRFKENKIVSALLDHAKSRGMDMNDIARMEFSRDDRDQFHQLIGYSVSNAPISEEIVDIAYRMHEEGEAEKDATIIELNRKLNVVSSAVRDAACELFNRHPDDLI